MLQCFILSFFLCCLWRVRGGLNQAYMSKPKAFLKDIFIGGNRTSSNLSREGQSAKETDKILHPPIETYWSLPPQEDNKKAPKQQKSRLSFSFKRRMRKSKSMQIILQGSHDPKDEEKVDSFRDFIFPDIPLAGKQFDYHTLLRYVFTIITLDF